jgi:hypothetical protein
MKTFIGVGLVNAKPMTRGEYNVLRGWELPEDEVGADEGYLVQRKDRTVTWTPKDVFDYGNYPIAGKNNTICQADVDNFIDSANANTIQVGGEDKTTFVTVVLKNGFVMHETSSCVDPKNYDEQVGSDICMAKIKDKIWFLLGFLLQSGVSGFKAVK